MLYEVITNLASGVGHVQFFAHNAFVCFQRGKGVFHQAFIHANLGADSLCKLSLRQVDVAVVRGLLQHIEGASLNSYNFV